MSLTNVLRQEIISRTLANYDERPVEDILASQSGEMGLNLSVEEHSSVLSEIDGYGPVSALLKDDSINEILINGFDRIFIERSTDLISTNLCFSSPITYQRFINRLLRDIGRIADQRYPMTDGSLPDGSRVHLTLPPISQNPVVAIRRHRRDSLIYDDLIKDKFFSGATAQRLRTEFLDKKNILVCGPTGSGKTTLLRALLKLLPENERVITVEDTDEIGLKTPSSVQLLSRVNLEKLVPDITLSDLVTGSLRMRPDRIVVGEIRHHEALAFIDAISTGHRGSISSIHGENAAQALSRLENLIWMAAPSWNRESIRQMIRQSVDIIVSTEKKDQHRHVSQVAEISGLESFGYLFHYWNLD